MLLPAFSVPASPAPELHLVIPLEFVNQSTRNAHLKEKKKVFFMLLLAVLVILIVHGSDCFVFLLQSHLVVYLV